VFTGRLSLPPGTLAEPCGLAGPFPAYDVIVTATARRYRFEAIRRDDAGNLVPDQQATALTLWRELRCGHGAARLLTGRPPGRRTTVPAPQPNDE